MATTDGFQVVHEALDGATRALPNQVSALGDTRQFLLSRQVPASAFANVDASAQAGATHNRTIDDNARQLAEARQRLDKIIADIRTTTGTVRRWDADKSTQQNTTGAVQLAQADTGTRTDADADIGTGAWGRGGAFLDGDQIRLRPRDDTVPSVTIPNNVGAQGFEVGPAYDVISREHTYRVQLDTSVPFDANATRFGDAIATNPVPTSGDQPASPTGARNDAMWNDYVRSYRIDSPNPGRYTDITVNYTIAGEHRLHEGYVIRYGERMPDGMTRIVSYGEGNALVQHPLNIFNRAAVDIVWNSNHLEILGSVLRQR